MRRGHILVLKEVDELSAILIVHRTIQGEGSLRPVSLDLLQLLSGDPRLLLKLLVARHLAGPCGDSLGGASYSVVGVEHMNGNTNGASLVGQRPADRMANPPARVGAESVTTVVVETLHRLHQADVPLLNEVDEREPASVVAAGNRHHQTKVRGDETILRSLLRTLGPTDAIEVLSEAARDANRVSMEVTLVGILARDTVDGLVGVLNEDPVAI